MQLIYDFIIAKNLYQKFAMELKTDLGQRARLLLAPGSPFYNKESIYL